jgi:hypothetical protein
MKTSIIYFKKSVNDAKRALEEDTVVVNPPPAAVDSPSIITVHLPITVGDLSTSIILYMATPGGEVDSISSMVLAAPFIVPLTHHWWCRLITVFLTRKLSLIQEFNLNRFPGKRLFQYALSNEI